MENIYFFIHGNGVNHFTPRFVSTKIINYPRNILGNKIHDVSRLKKLKLDSGYLKLEDSYFNQNSIVWVESIGIHDIASFTGSSALLKSRKLKAEKLWNSFKKL